MRDQDLINQKQAAAILGRSISAVSRAVKEGRLDYADIATGKFFICLGGAKGKLEKF